MNNSRHIGEFFKNTRTRFKGNVGYAFLGTLIYLLPFAIILAGSAWLSQLVSWLFATVLILAFALIGIMQIGHIRFIRMLAEGNERPSLKVLFSGFEKKNILNYMFVGIIMYLLYLVSTLLLVFPVFIVIALYSMVFYFIEHHKYDNFMDALKTTRKRMYHQKSTMLAYKAVFLAGEVILAVAFALLLMLALQIKNVVLAVVVIVLLHIAFYFLFSYVITHLSLCNQNFFAEVLDYTERRARKVVKPELQEKKDEVKEEKIEKVSATRKTTKKKDE